MLNCNTIAVNKECIQIIRKLRVNLLACRPWRRQFRVFHVLCTQRFPEEEKKKGDTYQIIKNKTEKKREIKVEKWREKMDYFNYLPFTYLRLHIQDGRYHMPVKHKHVNRQSRDKIK